jgi:formiminotetrahydrofolate cyclodeaminase
MGDQDPQTSNVTPEIPNFLQLPTETLLDEFGAGRHKPGSGSAAALLGLVACKMMQTVVTVTLRNTTYTENFAQLAFVDSVLTEQHEPFFREAIQRDSIQFDRYHRAALARRESIDPSERRRLTDRARQELMPATQIPFEIAEHGLDTAEKGLVVFDLGARYARGDSGVAVSSALSCCSGALFIVYLNLLQFREGQWATTMRASADGIAERYQLLQLEQFRRVSRIQAEGIPDPQLSLPISIQPPDDEIIV